MTLTCVGPDKEGGADGATMLEQLKGTPEGGALSSYFVLMKLGNEFTALPIEQIYGFKPIVQ